MACLKEVFWDPCSFLFILMTFLQQLSVTVDSLLTTVFFIGKLLQSRIVKIYKLTSMVPMTSSGAPAREARQRGTMGKKIW